MSGISQIFVMNADGSRQVQLTHEPANPGATDPAWSPDGAQIAFARSTAAFSTQIAVMNADGSGEKGLTTPGAERDDRPNFSPDGSRILFDSTRVGNQEVWVMNADGSAPTQLTTTPDVPDGGFSAWPNWSPDGTGIAFETNRDTLDRNNSANGAEVYVMNADGSSPVRLTHDAIADERPVWSPDGTLIAYSHETLNGPFNPGPLNLYVMNADGGNQHQIVADALEPDWQPNEPDRDGDGLPDDWETNGVDTPSGHLDLPAMGADLQHKDVFVELDPMAGDELSQGAIDAVEAAFARAPVPNPDGSQGIDLHVDNGPGSTMDALTGATWGALSAQDTIPHADPLGRPDGDDYDWSAFDGLRAQFFSPVRAPAFHYAISADTFDADQDSGISRGVGASDFIVALGPVCRPPTKSCTQAAQAGTFMHELGHKLGLRHGGGDDVNLKPNYLSIMNYAFQFTGLRHTDGTTTLDYSRLALPTLDETQLQESTGLQGPAGFETIGICPNGGKIRWPVSGVVDFDCDRVLSTAPVSADINGDKDLSVLTGFADWPTCNSRAAASGGSARPRRPPSPPQDEPSIAQLTAYANAPPAPPAVTPTPVPAPAPAQPAPATPRAKPLVLSQLRIKPARFRLSAAVSFRLSAAGRVRFTIVPRRKHCSFTRSGHAGTNRFTLRNRGLKPGRHRLRARPVQTGAKTSTVAFRIRR